MNMNNSLNTTAPDNLWQTWRHPDYIVGFVIIFVSIAIFAAVLILIACLPPYSTALDSGRLLGTFRRTYRRFRHRFRSRSEEPSAAFDLWSDFGDLGREHLPVVSTVAQVDLPPQPPPPTWRPSTSGRLAWSFASERSLTSQVPCESSNAATVAIRQTRTALGDLVRFLRRVGTDREQRRT